VFSHLIALFHHHNPKQLFKRNGTTVISRLNDMVKSNYGLKKKCHK